MWDLPGPGLEPVSPALAGGFLTTVPPEKSRMAILNNIGDGMYMIDKREEGMKDERGLPCPVPHLRGKASSFSTLSLMLPLRFVCLFIKILFLGQF